ncbi:hypothetical protein ABK040_001363 [Willaertia magna]
MNVLSPYFGERPHYMTPPSDLEIYRKLNNQLNNNKLNTEHYYIPYPNDPPYTFPAIKARQIFTKSPKKLSEVYIDRIDPLERSNLKIGAKLKVPLNQLEERFRTVYDRNNQLDITINSNSKDKELFERLGYLPNNNNNTTIIGNKNNKNNTMNDNKGNVGGGVDNNNELEVYDFHQHAIPTPSLYHHH